VIDEEEDTCDPDETLQGCAPPPLFGALPGRALSLWYPRPVAQVQHNFF